MDIEWRPVAGLEFRYDVSDTGQIRNRHTGRVLKTCITEWGYERLTIRGVPYRVHCVVAEAFIGAKPGPDYEVCHNNGVKTDNRVENLRWDTHSSNVLDNLARGLHNHARKTHCPEGHPYDETNTYQAMGRRWCRTCKKASDARRYARRKAARAT